MGLDARGGISLAQLLVYIPILCVSAVLVKRHGFRRQSGWVFLVLLSLVRITGGACHVAAEESSDPSTTLITIFSILESVGLSPLLLATVGFLGTVAEGVFENPSSYRAFHLLGLLASVSVILTVIGGVNISNAKTQDDVNGGTNFRHIGAIIFLVLFITIAFIHGLLWTLKHKIMTHRRVLLLGISVALPFLFVRIVYAVLSGYAPVSLPPTPPVHNSLSKFSSTSGSWAIYLFMSVLAEIVTVVIYLAFGTSIPISREYEQAYPMRGAREYGFRSTQALQQSHDQAEDSREGKIV